MSIEEAGARVAALSHWMDEYLADRHPEALTWHRVVKVCEEAGEVVEAMIGYTGGNPRKGYDKIADDVIEELLDVAVAALGAVEHLTDNTGTQAFPLLFAKIDKVYNRARGHGL